MTASFDIVPDRFITQRLKVDHWQEDLSDRDRCQLLERDLPGLLTPAVLAPLPPALWLDVPKAEVRAWIEARRAESEVYLVRRTPDSQLIGMLILACGSETQTPPVFHVGYLLAEAAWGYGYATELVTGFVSACRSGLGVRLLAGVEHNNAASARVLEKSGFLRYSDQAAGDTDMYFCDIP